MSDYIPFDIQKDILKNVSDIKSLIAFRSVSKGWKSFIETSEFVKGYSQRFSHTRSHALSYKSVYSWDDEDNYCLVDFDIETLKVQKHEAPSLLTQYRLSQYHLPFFVGASHGLLCWNGFNKVNEKHMLVIWNPAIRKSVGIAVPKCRYDHWIGYQRVYGFGVCPVTSDPTVIEVLCADNVRWYENKPWHVNIFTLSSGIWDVIPTGKLPRQSIILDNSTPVVVIDRFIYWGAWEKTVSDNGRSTKNCLIVSFDLITKEFNVVDLPDSLKDGSRVSVSKLRDSLVVSNHISVARGRLHCDVWVMDHDSSFRKQFTIGAPVTISGFKENGEAILSGRMVTNLHVYDPCLQQIKSLGISEKLEDLFFMGSYNESLLLLDHPDLHIYSEDS